MPFTPLHMGPGVLVKAVFQGGFSLMVFGWAQIVMDIQPLVVLLTVRRSFARLHAHLSRRNPPGVAVGVDWEVLV